MTCIEDQRELQFRRLIESIVMLKLDPPTVLRLQEMGASKRSVICYSASERTLSLPELMTRTLWAC